MTIKLIHLYNKIDATISIWKWKLIGLIKIIDIKRPSKYVSNELIFVLFVRVNIGWNSFYMHLISINKTFWSYLQFVFYAPTGWLSGLFDKTQFHMISGWKKKPAILLIDDTIFFFQFVVTSTFLQWKAKIVIFAQIEYI